MNKYRIGALLAALLISGTACKQTTADPEVTTAVSEGTTATETTVLQTTAYNVEEANPVGEDIYEAPETVTVDAEDVTIEVVVEDLDDPEFEENILRFLDPVYYNLFFGAGSYPEGIDEETMVKFAVSYVYQHEYNELKFDTTSFILYVPEKRVEQLVEKFFDFKVTGHHSFVEEGVMYEDGFYLMPAVDTGWGEKMALESAKATGDFSYEVILRLNYEGEDLEPFYKQVNIEVRDDRYVIIGYVDHEMAGGGEATEEETTEAEATTEASN